MFIKRTQYLQLKNFCHSVSDSWYQMSVILSTTAGMNWLSRIGERNLANPTSSLDEDLNALSQVRFLPYVSGERTPNNDAIFTGAFIIFSIESGISDMTQAVIKGVSFGLRDLAEVLKSTGTTLDKLFLVGGGSRSKYWLKLLTTVLDMSLLLPGLAKCDAALIAARLDLLASTGK